jgi:hypothetical protein
MGNFLRGLLKAYAALAAGLLSLLVLTALVLFWTGALTGGRVQAALQALRSEPPAPPAPAEKKPLDGAAEREQILGKRAQELQKLEERTVARLSLIKAEQETLERKRLEAVAATGEAKKAQEEYAQTKNDAELDANVPILSRMEAPGIVSVLKAWDDARFVRYLRAMRPAKAAEVLEALRLDPQLEEEFRKLPSDAPPGTKTRAERLSEEFKKAP